MVGIARKWRKIVVDTGFSKIFQGMQNTLIPSSLPSQISFRERFFAPIVEALERLDVGRECMAISDANWFMIGCLRVVSQETSGRGLLQRLCDLSIIEVNRQTFQESQTVRAVCARLKP